MQVAVLQKEQGVYRRKTPLSCFVREYMLWLDIIRRRSGKPPANILKETQLPLKDAPQADPAARLTAIAALAQEWNPLMTHTLLDSLGDPDARVRLAAAQLLEQHPDPAHRAQFVALLADENFEVRITATQFLGHIRDHDAAQPLVPLLTDSDSDVRRAAAQALGQIHNLAAVEPLVLTLADPEPTVRHAAAAALEEINPRWVRSNAAQRAIPRLEALRKNAQPWIAGAAQKVLEKLREAQDKDTAFWNRESGIRNL